MVGGLSDLCPISIRPPGKGPSPSAPPQGFSSSCSVASFLAFFYGGWGWGEGRGGRQGFWTRLALLLLREHFSRSFFN